MMGEMVDECMGGGVDAGRWMAMGPGLGEPGGRALQPFRTGAPGMSRPGRPLR